MSIKIDIEIGDENLQSLIKDELENIILIAEALKIDSDISQIIIPEDFQAKVIEITKDKEFKLQKGVKDSNITVMAKVLPSPNGVIILFASLNYLPVFDTMTRSFMLTHELVHVLNKKKFPEIPKNSRRLETYLSNLYQLFDEYTADRLSYEITERIFKKPTEIWEQFRENKFLDYIDSERHPTYYENIKLEIEKFKKHRDVDLHWNNIHEYMNVISHSTVHGFASYHQYPDENAGVLIPTTPFVNQSTHKLMDYFRNKFETNDTDLNDGIELITDYIENFGVAFENQPESKLWINVFDI